MNKHTPGPWSEPGTIGATRFEVQGAGRRIAVVDTLEDARLISTAPDLLNALRELVRLASKDWSCQMADGSVIEHPSLHRARELIGE